MAFNESLKEDPGLFHSYIVKSRGNVNNRRHKRC